MIKSLKVFTFFFSLGLFFATAQDEERIAFLADSLDVEKEVIEEYLAYQKYADSLEGTFSYQHGEVELNGGIAKIEVPTGYKFLDKIQASRVLSDLWGNPKDESLMGMLLKEDESPAETSYAVEITYSEDGYIDDEDAEDIDYDDLLEEMQDDVKTANPQRKQLGYPEIELIGWASKPFYDQNEKKLHWAKELLFEGEESNTLNYNIRVLGRNGYVNLNVIGEMDVLDDVKDNLDPILHSVTFNKGHLYSEFNPDFDDVAAYGIGGLIAGKVLAKAGFFALILKFWKFIAIGVVALFAGLKKRIFGSKEVAVVDNNKNNPENS